MNTKQLLINRKRNLSEGRVNWYSSLEWLRSFQSVKLVDFFDTTSSAGDWIGYFVQRIKNTNYLILFFQTSNGFHRYGYTVYTLEVYASWTGEVNRTEAESILNKLLAEQV